MPDADEKEPSDGDIERAGYYLAKTIWDVVMIAKSPTKARGLIGQQRRKELVIQIVDALRVVAGKKSRL